MTFDRLNRRTHLYLAMFLMPWFLMYGVSSIAFSHSVYDDGAGSWIPLFEKDFRVPLPAARDQDQEIGAQIMKEAGTEGEAFYIYRSQPRTVNVILFRFLAPRQIVYLADESKIVMQKQEFRWDRFLKSLHSRGGFRQDLFLNDAWAVTVDVVMIAILTWIASGIYMWWHVPAVRFWGFVALGGGCASFLLLLAGM
jgi:hypothetical protein